MIFKDYHPGSGKSNFTGVVLPEYLAKIPLVGISFVGVSII